MTRAFDGAGELALMFGGESSVFTRQDATLVCDIAAQEIHVLGFEIGDVHVHFRLGAGSATGGGVIIFARGHVT